MTSFNNIKPPPVSKEVGSHHPINQVKDFLMSILKEYFLDLYYSHLKLDKKVII